uniref:Zinc finger homeobox protein 2 n=1 Tax=Knipowitschia caucasica TaxID=637954 RepID=A0AAV2L345_KNICA
MSVFYLEQTLFRRSPERRSSLSLHLTEQHRVLPSCVEKLLDIASLRQAARAHDATGAQNSSETREDKEMEEEKVMDQENGELQLKTEEEGRHLTAAKRQATSRMKTGRDADSQSPPVPVLSRPFVSNKPYQCATCRVSYNHAITLESHMKSVLHQTRSRNAGIVENVASKSGNSPLVTAAPPAGLLVSSAKDAEQIQTSQVAPSLLTSPVASAQAVSAFLTLLTSSPNTLSHSILPSLFAAGATGAAAPQLVPQPQMVMPFILNGLQAQTQQLPDNQQSPLLTQCVPFLDLDDGKAVSLALSPAGADKSLRNNHLSPSVSMPSNSSPSPVHFNLTLSPDSTPQKSQSESRSEADAASPPRDDCEALGREVGLSEDESEPVPVKEVKEVNKVTMVKKIIPIKPKEVLPSTAVLAPSAAPKIKLETTSNVTMVKAPPKVNDPVVLLPPKDPSVVPRPAEKRKLEVSEEEVTDDEKDENQTALGPGSVNRMVPKMPTTPINNRPSATTTAIAVSQKQNGINYWTPKLPIKINTLSREQLALPSHPPPRCLAPPPTPTIAPVSPNTPNPAKVTSSHSLTPVAKSSPTEMFLSHSSSRRPRTHLSCLQLSILQSCYETCAHPNCLECEAIGAELNLPLKVVQIWFQNTRAKEKRWKLQQEKMTTPTGEKMDTTSGSYLQYSALKANRPILPKPVHLTTNVPASSIVGGQSTKECLTGHCDACDVSFDSRAAAREHVFSQHHLAILKTTNFGQPVPLVNKNGASNSGSSAGSGATPQTATSSNS